MKKVFILLFFPAFLFVTCTNDQTANYQLQQTAWDEMMVVHDEVMPKMKDINATSRDLKKWGQKNKETLSPSDLERMSVALKNLQEGDDGMMDWMNGIKQLDAMRNNLDHDAIMLYLKEQSKIIADVKEKMLSSIQEGNALMAELNAE